ncbi:hypothetical protein LCGC14_0983440 [marine sediment metagenome]|uniref:Uncharacterized protein n=1 Tax=marine sediment metagenome TaxID=412755 RepID=A0A0F9N7Y0_9ZZZZ
MNAAASQSKLVYFPDSGVAHVPTRYGSRRTHCGYYTDYMQRKPAEVALETRVICSRCRKIMYLSPSRVDRHHQWIVRLGVPRLRMTAERKLVGIRAKLQEMLSKRATGWTGWEACRELQDFIAGLEEDETNGE